AYTALAHYLAELTACEQELSMSARLVAVTPELAALAEDCAEKARADEPYRRAPRGIRGRLTANAPASPERRPQHEPDPGFAPHATPAALTGAPQRPPPAEQLQTGERGAAHHQQHRPLPGDLVTGRQQPQRLVARSSLHPTLPPTSDGSMSLGPASSRRHGRRGLTLARV
ncbi:hypothetical protein, partial [Mycobacterium avium]|uniref:hypothetical protein n=1 Tax=Mycobacterium avium TaxID=1764 RepID=UPI001E324493